MNAVTDVEKMTPEELQSLDLGRLQFALFEIGSALSECGRQAVSARLGMAAIRVRFANAGAPRADRQAFNAEMEVAKAEFDAIGFRIRGLRDLKTTLQTIVRSIP